MWVIHVCLAHPTLTPFASPVFAHPVFVVTWSLLFIAYVTLCETGPHHTVQASLELTMEPSLASNSWITPASASKVLGFQACPTMPSLCDLFNFLL